MSREKKKTATTAGRSKLLSAYWKHVNRIRTSYTRQTETKRQHLETTSFILGPPFRAEQKCLPLPAWLGLHVSRWLCQANNDAAGI